MISSSQSVQGTILRTKSSSPHRTNRPTSRPDPPPTRPPVVESDVYCRSCTRWWMKQLASVFLYVTLPTFDRRCGCLHSGSSSQGGALLPANLIEFGTGWWRPQRHDQPAYREAGILAVDSGVPLSPHHHFFSPTRTAQYTFPTTYNSNSPAQPPPYWRDMYVMAEEPHCTSLKRECSCHSFGDARRANPSEACIVAPRPCAYTCRR